MKLPCFRSPGAWSNPALLLLVLALTGLAGAAPARAQAPIAQPNAAASHPTRGFWRELNGAPPAVSATGAQVSVRARHFRAAYLDRVAMQAAVAAAPAERSPAARQSPLVISLPDPRGGFERFAITDSPVMEAGLAARHPEIRTFAGRGIDDPGASLRMDITPLGLHASIRSSRGSWYIDPYYHLDDSLYVSYFTRDLVNPHGALVEPASAEAQLSLAHSFYHAADTVEVRGIGFAAGAQVTISVRNSDADAAPRQTIYTVAGPDGSIVASLRADPYRSLGSFELSASDGRASATATYQVLQDDLPASASVGNILRTYRLALVTDPSYAAYFGGPTNVTAAKVTLINRVTQVYEDETSIRLVLVAGNDALNLDTAAQMTGANGPCGGSACFTASQVASCGSSTLSRNRVVVGLLVGASNFDVGHIALGVNGGGIASLGVVGSSNKAQGCTGIPTPVGDVFAVDYVAHEMGHEFAGNHSFNGTVSNCSGGNRNAGTSVEPGSGSSIMAYAGICGSDDLQSHSDPYWSQRSFDEIVSYTSATERKLSEVQMAALTGFSSNGQQFVLRLNGNASAAIVRGSNFTAAGVQAAIQGIAGWPAGATAKVSALSDTGFTVTFGGTLAKTDTGALELVNCSAGCSGYVGEITKGGATTRRGSASATGNRAPVVSVPATFTIPVRTPFVLSGSASDADSDALTYLWEQNDRGANSGTGLVTQPKLNGPLFRQFGTQALVSASDTLQYGSPGEHAATHDPQRVFPDMAQILANNTNAENGSCAAPSGSPSAAQIDCFSEFLPTTDYVGYGSNAAPPSLNFRLTARDGHGGVGNAATTLVLAPGAGPFLVTAPNSAVVLDGGSPQNVTWSVANTNNAPVNAASVKISLSVDGGSSFPYVLAASTPNDGAQTVTLPNVASSAARIKIEALGNVFFDVSNADFTIRLLGDVTGDGNVDCADLAAVKASFGRHAGEPGFNPAADVNGDGVVNLRDLAFVSQKLPAGTVCP